MKHILVGRKSDGSTVYYTGRAGQAFVSSQLADVFTYDSLEQARRRALNLNQMTAIHGIRFIVPCGDLGASSTPEHHATVLP